MESNDKCEEGFLLLHSSELNFVVQQQYTQFEN